jgi:uncharacterized phiE125 gp8 family phage protein
MAYKIITPASAVITTAELKAHMRVDSSSEDSLIDAYLLASMAYCQHYTGMAIGEQTVEIALDEFPEGPIKLELTPATSIETVRYVDTNGDWQTVSSSLYTTDIYGQDHWLLRAAGSYWPDTYDSANSVKVRYIAGSSTLDPAVKAALMLLTGNYYENREEATEKRLSNVPMGVNALLDTVKVWRL